MGEELDIVNELIKLSWDVLDSGMSGAGFLGLWYFTLRLLQRVVNSLCLVQEVSLSHSTCVCPLRPRTWQPWAVQPQSNADTQIQQSQMGYTWMMFTYPNFGALFSIAAWPLIVNKSQYSILCWFCLIPCKGLTLEVHLVSPRGFIWGTNTASAFCGTFGLQLCTSNSAKWKEEVARLL